MRRFRRITPYAAHAPHNRAHYHEALLADQCRAERAAGCASSDDVAGIPAGTSIRLLTTRWPTGVGLMARFRGVVP